MGTLTHSPTHQGTAHSTTFLTGVGVQATIWRSSLPPVALALLGLEKQAESFCAGVPYSHDHLSGLPLLSMDVPWP